MPYRLIKQTGLTIQAEELFKVLRREGFAQAGRVGCDQYLEIVLHIVISTLYHTILLWECSTRTCLSLPITIHRSLSTLFRQPYVVLAAGTVKPYAFAREPACAPGRQQRFILRLRVRSAGSHISFRRFREAYACSQVPRRQAAAADSCHCLKKGVVRTNHVAG